MGELILYHYQLAHNDITIVIKLHNTTCLHITIILCLCVWPALNLTDQLTIRWPPFAPNITTGRVADMVNPFSGGYNYSNLIIRLFWDGGRYIENTGYLDREACPSISTIPG